MGNIPPGVWWRAVVVLAAGLVLALGLLGTILLLAFPLALLLAAIVLAAALAPAVDWLEQRLSRTAAVAVVYVALLLVAAGLVLQFPLDALGLGSGGAR
ncbi:MAG: hypothetical protein ACRDI2_26885 [Chloroflexota bacterium]